MPRREHKKRVGNKGEDGYTKRRGGRIRPVPIKRKGGMVRPRRMAGGGRPRGNSFYEGMPTTEFDKLYVCNITGKTRSNCNVRPGITAARPPDLPINCNGGCNTGSGGYGLCTDMCVPPGDFECAYQYSHPCQSHQDCFDYATANGLGWCGYPANDHCLHCAYPYDANGGPYTDWGFGCCACFCQ